jgi:hypothetical protein
MHDSFNLAWKLNLVIRDLAVPEILCTYEDERRKIAKDLINFDAEHVKAFTEGDEALARNFDENIRFIAGVGAEYSTNMLNSPISKSLPSSNGSGPQPGLIAGSLKPGAILMPPTQVTRYVDANPVHFQLEIPMLGQFRIYIFAPDIIASKGFVDGFCTHLSSPTSVLSRASVRADASYAAKPPGRAPSDKYTTYPERYTPVSKLFTYALVTCTPKKDFEIAASHLPSLLQASRWSVYVDDNMSKPSCTETYLGSDFMAAKGHVAIVNVRPDGYVGSLKAFGGANLAAGAEAGRWVEEYYGGFLKA